MHFYEVRGPDAGGSYSIVRIAHGDEESGEILLGRKYESQAAAQRVADGLASDPFDIAGSDDRAIEYLESLANGTAYKFPRTKRGG